MELNGMAPPGLVFTSREDKSCILLCFLGLVEIPYKIILHVKNTFGKIPLPSEKS